jgi:hypothetical protein
LKLPLEQSAKESAGFVGRRGTSGTQWRQGVAGQPEIRRRSSSWQLMLCLLIDVVEICPGTDLLAQAKDEVTRC